MPNDNAFLRVALNIDNRMNMNLLLCLFETIYLHLDRIRDFLVIEQQNLLTENFTHKEFGRFVRELVFTEIRRTIW